MAENVAKTSLVFRDVGCTIVYLADHYLEILEYVRYLAAQRGDDRCWKDYEKLFQMLPEGYTAPAVDTIIELENCRKYLNSCNDPGVTYVSPQRRIEELERRLTEAEKELEDERGRWRD